MWPHNIYNITRRACYCRQSNPFPFRARKSINLHHHHHRRRRRGRRRIIIYVIRNGRRRRRSAGCGFSIENPARLRLAFIFASLLRSTNGNPRLAGTSCGVPGQVRRTVPTYARVVVSCTRTLRFASRFRSISLGAKWSSENDFPAAKKLRNAAPTAVGVARPIGIGTVEVYNIIATWR